MSIILIQTSKNSYILETKTDNEVPLCSGVRIYNMLFFRE